MRCVTARQGQGLRPGHHAQGGVAAPRAAARGPGGRRVGGEPRARARRRQREACDGAHRALLWRPGGGAAGRASSLRQCLGVQQLRQRGASPRRLRLRGKAPLAKACAKVGSVRPGTAKCVSRMVRRGRCAACTLLICVRARQILLEGRTKVFLYENETSQDETVQVWAAQTYPVYPICLAAPVSERAAAGQDVITALQLSPAQAATWFLLSGCGAALLPTCRRPCPRAGQLQWPAAAQAAAGGQPESGCARAGGGAGSRSQARHAPGPRARRRGRASCAAAAAAAAAAARRACARSQGAGGHRGARARGSRAQRAQRHLCWAACQAAAAGRRVRAERGEPTGAARGCAAALCKSRS